MIIQYSLSFHLQFHVDYLNIQRQLYLIYLIMFHIQHYQPFQMRQYYVNDNDD